MDRSWGGTGDGLRIRTNESPDERAAARARDRAARAGERAAAMADRHEARATAREADRTANERARVERRERERLSASGDPHAEAARRPRTSGRKDVVKDQRDTRGYATVIDEGRIRTLAKRGASVAGLAGAFAIAEAEVLRILAQ